METRTRCCAAHFLLTPWNTCSSFLIKFETGVGVEKPNNWAFDTTQFDSILKRLKVVYIIIQL